MAGPLMKTVLEALKARDLPRLLEAFAADPFITGNTVLHYGEYCSVFVYACRYSAHAIVRHLLKDPNLKMGRGEDLGGHSGSILFGQCLRPHSRILRLLLADTRLEMNARTWGRLTVLMQAGKSGGSARKSSLRFLHEVAASGRTFDFALRGRFRFGSLATGFQIAELTVLDMLDVIHRNDKVAEMIRLMASDPGEAARQARLALGMTVAAGAKVYALIVFFSDDFLRLRDTIEPGRLPRFIDIAAQLPLDLQQVLCLRVAGCQRQYIPHAASEHAFRSLTAKWPMQ